MRLGRDGRMLYANEAGKPLLVSWGCRVGEPCGYLEEIVGRVFWSGKTVETDIKSGDKVFYFSIVPILDRGYVNLYGYDVTEKRALEGRLKEEKKGIEKVARKKTEELSHAHENLEKARRLADIGTLASTVAHELRNPLGVIGSAVYNISRKRRNPEIDRNLANIEKKIAESERIINNLLSYSRLKEPKYEAFNICDALKEAISSVKTRYNNISARIITKYPPREECPMEGDRFQIREVLDNVLGNAAQAVGEKGGTIEARIKADRSGDIEICIRDNGKGMSEEVLDKVFEPFFTTRSKGTGLGLSICNELVNLHNGSIDIDSAPGRGTAVTITLPARRG